MGESDRHTHYRNYNAYCTRCSGTVMALREGRVRGGLRPPRIEVWNDMPREPPSDMPHNKHVRAIPFHPLTYS